MSFLRLAFVGVVTSGCGGSVASSNDAGFDVTVMSCTFGATCFEATGLTSFALSSCKSHDAAVVEQACPAGEVGCCELGGVLGAFKRCEYPPTTVDAAATACSAIDGGTFSP